MPLFNTVLSVTGVAQSGIKVNVRNRSCVILTGSITAKAEQIRVKFQTLLDKTNKEQPQLKDVKAISDLLVGNKSLELWRGIASAGYLAELTVIENARASTAVKEC